MKDHDQSCIFCKISKGELSSYTIFESSTVMAFLDIRPFSSGHTLLIPREHYRWIWDLPNEMLEEFYSSANQIAKKLKVVFETDNVYSLTMGEMVPHCHLHIIPDSNIGFSGNLSKLLEKERLSPTEDELLSLCDKIRSSD